MKLLFITTIFTFITIVAIAQDKINFSSQNYVGLLVGENVFKFQLQTINGIKYKTWFAGIGTGIDWYYLRSIPLFASFSKYFFGIKQRGFYLSADGGINFIWTDNKDYNVIPGGKLYSGPYWAAGLGYRIGTGKRDALLFYAGYSYKHLIEKNTIYMADAPLWDRYDYHLRRLSIKIGYNF